jgi:hypothetical protein
MHEQAKIDEAEFFLERIGESSNDPSATRHYISAFLTAARSVLQYALADASTKSGGQTWYETAFSSDPLIKFLKDHRDINVHGR